MKSNFTIYNLQFTIIFLLILLFPVTCTMYPTFAHSDVQVIEMTQNGFEPNSVTIDTNSAVIFLNKDKNPRWPASNVHPTHDIYPEFDPKKEIEAGKDWSFNPKKAGSFKFHDHLFPHFRGVLIVNSEPDSVFKEIKETNPFLDLVNKIKETFSNLLKKIISLSKFKEDKVIQTPNLNKVPSDKQLKVLEDYANEAGAEKGWELVRETFNNQAGSEGNIHDLAHLSGSLLFKQKGFEAISSCTTQFAFGCFHGFLDEAFKKDLSKLNEAHMACSKLAPQLTGPVASCIHGIGHGIASYYSTSNLKTSLAECRKFTTGNEYCFDGVFMEFARGAPENFYKRDDPLYPCNELEANFGPAYTFSCGRNLPSLMMGRFKMGFDEVVSICLSAKSKQLKLACVDSLGFSLAASQNVDQVIQGCQKMSDPQLITRCTKAAAGELIFQEVPGWPEKSESICNAFPKSQQDCRAYLDRLIEDYGRVKKLPQNP